MRRTDSSTPCADSPTLVDEPRRQEGGGLELRVREETGKSRKAEDLADRLKHESGGLLSRLFTSTAGGSPVTAGAKEAWAERPAPSLLTDTQRIPVGYAPGGRL